MGFLFRQIYEERYEPNIAINALENFNQLTHYVCDTRNTPSSKDVALTIGRVLKAHSCWDLKLYIL